MIAILPAAGRGTRMTTLTGGKAKEMIALRGISVLETVIVEGRSAGATEIVVVSSPLKSELTALAMSLGATIALQNEPLGLAHAISCANVEQSALILLPDTVVSASVSLRMADALSAGADVVVAVETVPSERVKSYGIVEWDEASGVISRILEKPHPDETPSRWAVAARYGFSARMMSLISDRVSSIDAGEPEIALGPLINQAIALGWCAKAIPLLEGERRWDCGDPENYRTAFQELG